MSGPFNGRICPVDGCTRDRGGENFLMCKPCWRVVPTELKRHWRMTVRDAKKALKALKAHQCSKEAAQLILREYGLAKRRCIDAAHLEPVQ